MDKKEYLRQWRKKNADKFKATKKAYYEKNKDKIREQQKKYHKKWYQVNKKDKDAKNKKWHQNNKKCSVEIVQAYVKRNKEKVIKYNKGYQQTSDGLFRTTKYNAKQKNNEFLLTKQQFEKIVSKPCQYCGEKIERRGIDRINNNKGYTIENSAPCCKMCNYMKKNYHLEEFLLHIEKIYKHNL